MITKQMTMVEILYMDERIAGTLTSYGLDCSNCAGAQSETLEEAAQGHGVDLDELLNALKIVLGNRIITEN